jgi:hypothetical protein
MKTIFDNGQSFFLPFGDTIDDTKKMFGKNGPKSPYL